MSETSDVKTDEQSKLPAPGVRVEDQQLLVGDHVYIRAVEEDFAEYGMSWLNTHYPKGPDYTKNWINEDMKKAKHETWYVILRKTDARPIGSIKVDAWAHSRFVESFVDPLFGDQGAQWEAEAMTMFIPWMVDEQHRVIAIMDGIPADKTVLIDALKAIGCRESVRYHEQFRKGSGWQDALLLDYPNKEWMKTLGDPANDPLERTGTGEPRPVSPVVPVTGPMPRNAIKVGERVYLRAMDASDMVLNAEWSRRDTETFWSLGRGMMSIPAGQQWINRVQDDEPQEWVRFTVCLRENDMPIGFVGLDGVNYRHRYAESESELFRPDYRGGGYGSEAKHLMFDYAFNDLGLHSIQSWVLFENTRSAAALRKQGYVEIGRVHWQAQNKGRYDHFVVFELLEDRWRSLPRRTPGAGKQA